MRKYYAFLIDSYVLDTYLYDTKSLYKTINKMINSNIDIKYRLSIYEQLINIIDKEIFISYIESKFKKYKKNNNKYILKYNGESCLIKINYSHIEIYTNKNYSFIFNILLVYNKNFFVCDFNNDDYFFLKKISNKLDNFNNI